MKVLILGASGVIGQHMRLCTPDGVEPVWVRKTADDLHRGVDLTDHAATEAFLDATRPNVIVNLAGESRPDVVEKDPSASVVINVGLPRLLAEWCDRNSAKIVHVSTQAVFDGKAPPYWSRSRMASVNEYGNQKIAAEFQVREVAGNWVIVRPTFVLGVRPLPKVGRVNPIEQMLAPGPQKHAGDRWFSVSFAHDVAKTLWDLAVGSCSREIVHVGFGRVSRFELAEKVQPGVSERVSHDDFPGIAPRPRDTSYTEAVYEDDLVSKINRCRETFASRDALGLEQRAREISLFTGMSVDRVLKKLWQGFGAMHVEVAKDFRKADPGSDDAKLLEWYRSTDAYIWELTAYHADAGFNYSGMCKGVVERLKTAGAKRVLCLGDGIGDMTLTLCRAGLEGVYHDLAGGRTAGFAQMRLGMYLATDDATDAMAEVLTTPGWAPTFVDGRDGTFDAITAFDFLEHVTDVPAWANAIYRALKPGGLFFAQNAFAIGSGEEGSIPMHLARNDRFEKDWDPMLFEMGFEQLNSNWYQKK